MGLTVAERAILVLSIVAGLLGIIVGYGLPSSGTNILKDFLVLCSGGGITFVFAMAGARVASSERVRSVGSRSVQRLGLAASHVRDAARSIRAHAGENSSLLLIATQLDNVAEESEVSIGDIEMMSGGKMSLDPLVQTALQGIEAAVERVLPGEPHEVKSKVLSAIAEPLRKFEAEVKEAAVAVRQATHPCPQCSASMSTVLGESPGSTVHTTCGKCGSQMTVHRMPDGSVLSRVMLPKIRISCPGCKSDIAIKVKPDDPEIVVRNCYKCDERIYVDIVQGTISRSEKRAPLETTYVLEDGKAAITCPSCMYELRVAYDPQFPAVKASCARCTSLIRAKPAA